MEVEQSFHNFFLDNHKCTSGTLYYILVKMEFSTLVTIKSNYKSTLENMKPPCVLKNLISSQDLIHY